MIKAVIILMLYIMLTIPAFAGLLINEIACATSGDDWVEIFLHSEDREKIDVSPLYVTMYYGDNQRLSSDPIHIYSYDRPETPYDDRFLVIHLTEANKSDESDLTGDTNKNGYIDVYCNNYYGSLWNSDCVVAIDADDDPSNGGIIDFVAYSNRDGSINDTIWSYVRDAQNYGQWLESDGPDPQESMIYIGSGGLSSYSSISRKNSIDNNSQDDFEITKFQTPGRENILSGGVLGKGRLFRSLKKRITIIPGHPLLGAGEIGLFVYERCSIRLRIFSSIGMLIYESPLYRDVHPGRLNLNWNLKGQNRRACTGLYIGYIEATSKMLKKTESDRIFIILSKYK
ncbi:MAG: hypothetical protein SVZ03_03200 [Spirochaetota bacterium]|nr:hypothetical protein [Spirochaetota bacterium]